METIVIDQNSFRKPALVNLLQTDANTLIAIPDVALIEMCKSQQWESTLRASLLPLVPYIERCIYLKKDEELLRDEAENHKALEGSSLIYEDFTPVFRSLVKELPSGGDGPEIAKLRKEVPSIIKDTETVGLHKANMSLLSGTVAVLHDSFSKQVTKALRNGSINQDLEIELIKLNMPKLMTSYLDTVSFPYEYRESYLEKKPFAYRFVALQLWLSIHWLKKGGLESLPERKATNYIMDNEYALMASYFDGFLSEDTLANDAYEALRKIISQ